LERIQTARNFDFKNYKRATLRRRVERRVQDRRCQSIAQYADLLTREPAEFDSLISSMLIKVTGFFRDEETWRVLRTKTLPQLLSHRRPGEELRIWSAGCATGEEAYSLAILLGEALGPAFANAPLKIFGTDVDEGAVSHARRGIYTAQQVESVPKATLARWFRQGPEGYQVRKELRRLVLFGVNNLVSDAPISRLNLLLCRNVFIYLNAQLQKRVLTRFHYALRPEGLLVLGKSELLPFAGKLFQPVDLSRRIYKKDGRPERVVQGRLIELLDDQAHDPGAAAIDERAGIGQYYRDVLHSLQNPVLATALDGTVTLWNAAAGRLWGRSEGEIIGKKLATLSLAGISGDLVIERTTLVREGRSERETTEATVGADTDGGRPSLLNIEVTPLRGGNDHITGLLYMVQDVTRYRTLENDLRRVSEERQRAVEELQTANEELQSTNEELETTNEELQSANEELQSTNEELQSTNEELETTNEELQSTIAELDATNRELGHRTEELNMMGFYQRTIIRSLAAAVVVLDQHGRITMWNLAAERLLGLPENEAVGQTFWTLHIPALGRSLIARIRKSLTQGNALRVDEVAYQLATGAHGYGNVAAVPLTDAGSNLGALILFEDTTRAVSLAQRLAKSKEGRRK
jgi:two-component system CheB/CheR fusion protein